MCVFARVCVFLCVYACVRACICVWKGKHRLQPSNQYTLQINTIALPLEGSVQRGKQVTCSDLLAHKRLFASFPSQPYCLSQPSCPVSSSSLTRQEHQAHFNEPLEVGTEEWPINGKGKQNLKSILLCWMSWKFWSCQEKTAWRM